MLTSAIVRFIARNSDALVAFITSLDARLDVFLAKHDADVAAFEQDIEIALERAEAEVARIRAQAEDAVDTIQSKIGDAAKTAAIVAAVKAALPGATVTTPVTNTAE